MRHQSGWHNSYSGAVLAGLAAALLFAPAGTEGQNPAAGTVSPSPAASGAQRADQKPPAPQSLKPGTPGRAKPAPAKRAAGYPPKVGGPAGTRLAQAGGASDQRARSGGPVPGASGTGQLKSAS